jgi:hypothetical protein
MLYFKMNPLYYIHILFLLTLRVQGRTPDRILEAIVNLENQELLVLSARLELDENPHDSEQSAVYDDARDTFRRKLSVANLLIDQREDFLLHALEGLAASARVERQYSRRARRLLETLSLLAINLRQIKFDVPSTLAEVESDMWKQIVESVLNLQVPEKHATISFFNSAQTQAKEFMLANHIEAQPVLKSIQDAIIRALGQTMTQGSTAAEEEKLRRLLRINKFRRDRVESMSKSFEKQFSDLKK